MESQSLDPDLLPPRARPRAHARAREGNQRTAGPARDPKRRFAKGHSGNPKGRPAGIANPKRPVIDFSRPLVPGALSRLVERKPWLLRPILA